MTDRSPKAKGWFLYAELPAWMQPAMEIAVKEECVRSKREWVESTLSVLLAPYRNGHE